MSKEAKIIYRKNEKKVKDRIKIILFWFSSVINSYCHGVTLQYKGK